MKIITCICKCTFCVHLAFSKGTEMAVIVFLIMLLLKTEMSPTLISKHREDMLQYIDRWGTCPYKVYANLGSTVIIKCEL